VEGEATAEARLHDEMMARELKCEGGSGVLPVARSAVPAGTQASAAANLLLTYTLPIRTAGRGRPIAGAQAGVLARTQG
jgi:hypothetical protein